MQLALDTLRALAKREPELQTDDLHGLMRVHEATNIRLNAELVATAAMARQESRTGSSHHRLDYPQSDDTNWRKFIIIEKGEDGPNVSTLAASEPLANKFTRKNVPADNDQKILKSAV